MLQTSNIIRTGVLILTNIELAYRFYQCTYWHYRCFKRNIWRTWSRYWKCSLDGNTRWFNLWIKFRITCFSRSLCE